MTSHFMEIFFLVAYFLLIWGVGVVEIVFKSFSWGNESLYLHSTALFSKNSLDRPNSRYGRYDLDSSSSIRISTIGVDGARASRSRFQFLCVVVVVVVQDNCALEQAHFFVIGLSGPNAQAVLHSGKN